MEGIGAFGIQQKLMAPEKKAERALLTEARKYETEQRIAEQQRQFNLMYPLHKAEADAKVAKAAEPSPAQVKQQEAETAAEQGKRDLTTTVTGIAETLDKLDELGGAVNTKNSGLKNAMARTAGSTVGQLIGGTFGTQEQTYRDILKNSQMALLNDIKAANPKISSKQIDSNAELKTWLASLGDETQSIQARKQTLKNIVTKYGTPGGYDWENEGNVGAPKTPTKPPEGVAPGATIKSTRKLKNGRTGVEWSDGSRTIQ
jgi:hypothetical protein